MVYHNRIFLSVDLTGSTSFKYESDSSEIALENKWEQVILSFYQSFPKSFKKELVRLNRALGSRLETWKFLGDEIIFTARIEDFSESLPIVASFRRALIDYRDKLKDMPELSAKGAAWLADIGYRNKEIRAFSSSQSRSSGAFRARDYDFIGQSMDTGFRIASLADVRRMTLSLELALIVAEAERREGTRHLPWAYGKRARLKGVLGQRYGEYPLIFLDTESHHVRPAFNNEKQRLYDAEERLSERRQTPPTDIADLARAFISINKKFLYEPYFPGCEAFGIEPEAISRWREGRAIDGNAVHDELLSETENAAEDEQGQEDIREIDIPL